MDGFAKWLWNVLVAIDQVGNAIAGGDPDITISARVGFFANRSQNREFHYYWVFLERVIDFTFYPLDGPKHCLQSLCKDNEQGHVHGSDFVRGVLALIAISACVFISVLTWTAFLLGQRPKRK